MNDKVRKKNNKMSTFLLTDVTAVTLYRTDSVLAGIGSYMFIYSISSAKPRQRLLCLHGQKVHGFTIDYSHKSASIIAFGGKQFSIVTGPIGNKHKDFRRRVGPVACEDWLHSCAWLRGSTDHVFLLTAHNVVLKYNIDKLELVSRFVSRDNSILYSGLLLSLNHDLLVMSGTGFSEVILQVCGEVQPLHRLTGHRGVIFSISCYPEKHIIVTTSDDRSVRIWGRSYGTEDAWYSTNYWRKEIVCKHELYGHNSRVMRSCISDDYIISVGENSHLCFWTHKGDLIKKMKKHPNANVWSIASHKNSLVTGGGNGAVTYQSSLSSANDHPVVEGLDFSETLGGDLKPRQVGFTAKHNLFILYEKNNFIYYKTKDKAISRILKLTDKVETSFYSLRMSPNRNMCVLVGCENFLYVIIEDESDIRAIKVELKVNAIQSAHWATQYFIVTCTIYGHITIYLLTRKALFLHMHSIYELPDCKERWLSCAAMSLRAEVFLLGDRCGNIHLYRNRRKHPITTLRDVHGRYGPTSITFVSRFDAVTTGRDKTIKYFKINYYSMNHIATREVDFQWVDGFSNVNQVVFGFKEKMFVVYTLKTNEKVLEINCGGAHRSYDLLCYDEPNKGNGKQAVLKLMYLQNSVITTATIMLNDIVSIGIAMASHDKEINCLKSHQVGTHTLFISGGEDTTLRVSILENDLKLGELALSKHLSSVRTLKVYARTRDKIYSISAGGRAQICIKLYSIYIDETVEVETRDLVNYMMKGTDRQRKGERKNWRSMLDTVDAEPETRIMDIDYVTNKNGFTIFAGCSDARIRVFTLNIHSESFKKINESKNLNCCILKTVCVKYLKYDVLLSCTTRGETALWDITNVKKDDEFKPFFEMRTNKSGINSVVTRILSDHRMLVCTGGDDNALHLTVLHVADQNTLSSMRVLHSLVLDKNHSSAITGLCMVGEYILSTSIDQRITLYTWKVTDKIECKYINQTFSDVADIKGIELITQNSLKITVCVYGKGMEVFDIPITKA